ncbi:putative oxidoreductase [Papilio xuthus]|uniref:Putative oxidoreductase n=1 Tax=Papilio xuthus TaxID=66420 RepID=A0A194PUH3_PAPXU|nr:putative oxidoreductase [Papilio xuthus]
MDFTNKVVLITGASSGIGAACAVLFARASAKLAIVGRNMNNLKKVAENCETESGHTPLLISADITVEDDVEKIVKETLDCYEKIDVLVNNVGMSIIAGVRDGVKPLDTIMETNIRGTYMLTYRVIPYLEATKGNIVNVSSVLSTKAMSTMTPYCMSKAAMDMFTKCLAMELAEKGVRVNSVNPGPVRTNFFTRAGINSEHNDELMKNFAAMLPLKMVCESEDVAEMIIYLASDKARCVTGSCMLIDCGTKIGKVEKLM